MPDLPDALVAYIAERDRQRRVAVSRLLERMTDRERLLVREVAVMANVRGTQRGLVGSRDIPADSAVLHDALDACLAIPDLYPTVASLDSDSPPDGE